MMSFLKRRVTKIFWSTVIKAALRELSCSLQNISLGLDRKKFTELIVVAVEVSLTGGRIWSSDST